MNSWNLFDTGKLSEQLQAVYNGYEAMAHSAFQFFSSDKNRLSFSFLDDRQFNAKAREVGGMFQIGINISVPVILQFSYNVLLRSPELFPYIGKVDPSEKYSEFANGIPLTLPPTLDMNELIYEIIGISRPFNEQRAVTAFNLSSIATRFVIYHELAHLVLGHVKAIQKCFPGHQLNNQLTELIDINTIPQPPVDNELRQIWEFEADSMAAIMVIADLLSDDNKTFIHESFVSLQMDSSTFAN